jgi:3-phenylpropionate/trans-cinnamate dioxygenase ferredoxin reductase component
MTTDPTLVIIGASLAGAKAAEGARAAGFDGRVVLVGEEPHRPYERPPLSETVLRGEQPPEVARVHDDAFYAANDIELLLGRRVVGLDPNARQIRLDGDETLGYTAAVLATGAAPRHIDIPGASLARVWCVNSMC